MILLSLNGLGVELRLARWLPLARVCARLLSTEPLHPCVYTPVAAGVVRLAVFASDGWRNEAVEAGLPSGAARTVYFGVPLGRRLPDEHPFEYRLLWVGRLSREKGLHHFIDAVAQLRRTQPATLTAVCGPGPAEYERAVRRQIERRGLGNAVRLMPPVERDALPAVYAAHDALLFDSPFAEPVALVVMEAFAAGLPVLTRRPAAAGPLLRPDETCLCFQTSSPRAIAAAVCRAAEDQALRRAVRRRAYALVRQRFSVEDTTAAYDDILYDLLRTANG